jgi:hypothetical protein
MSKVNFKPEHLETLQNVFVELCFGEKVLTGTFGANKINPLEILNSTTVGGCKAILQKLLGQQNALNQSGVSEWEIDDENKTVSAELDLWIKFVNLCIGYKLDKEQKALEKTERELEIAQLEKDAARERKKNQTLETIEARLKELKGE